MIKLRKIVNITIPKKSLEQIKIMELEEENKMLKKELQETKNLLCTKLVELLHAIMLMGISQQLAKEFAGYIVRHDKKGRKK